MTEDADDRDSVAALIHTVGRRAAPPSEDYDRVLAASEAAWKRAVRQRIRRRWTYAIAAGVALVMLGAGLLRNLDARRPVIAGTLATASGAVFAGTAAGDDWRW